MSSERTVTIEDRILHIFRRKMELDVNPQTDVIESGLLDSLSFVTLLASLESEFEIHIDVENLDLDDFRSPRSICRYVAGIRSLE